MRKRLIRYGKTKVSAFIVAAIVFCATTSVHAQSTQPRPRLQPGTRTAQGPQNAPGAVRRQGPAPPPPARVQQQPRAPFVLTPEQQAELDQVLGKWEEHSGGIKTLSCKFTRKEHDEVFKRQTTSEGELKYAAPDRGLYRVRNEKGEFTDHWVSNGKSIFVFDAPQKQLKEHPLPPELQGEAIADGPLPFLFGAKASKLKQRYWMRITTRPAERAKGEIWIEAYPRIQRDAANFIKAEVVLREQKNLTISGLRIVETNGKTIVDHVFDEPTVNSPFRFLERDFSEPATPFGWKKIVEPPPATVPPAEARRNVRPPRR